MEVCALTTCQHCGALSQGAAFCCRACENLAHRFEATPVTLDPELLYLDQPHFRDLYRHGRSDFDYQLYVEGLECSSCVHLVEKMPDFDDTIREARVNFATARLAIKSGPDFSLARAATLLKSWGYTPRFLKSEESNQNDLVQENRSSLKKLATAGACAGNIMLFVIPVYAGLAGPWGVLFNWMSFFLFLPILLYAATPFYRGAWNSLRYQTVNVDLPVTIALWAGFLLSTLNLIRGQGAIYFDSTASFLFLILSARYLLKRVQQNFLSAYRIRDFIQTDQFQKKSNGAWTSVSFEDLKSGDEIKLMRGQNCPVDGAITSPEGLIDLSVLNGEAMPRHFHRGMEILAGCKILSEEIEVTVTHEPSKTRLAELLRELDERSWQKSDFVSLTDRLAQKLILAVFGIAVLFFALYFNHNPQEAFDRALALIVLACPCALAFGSPLTLGLALRKAQQNGILIKNANSFEKILKVNNLFFDKTGTLTELELDLASTEPAVLDERIRTILVSLEQQSYHPVAFCLRKTWPSLRPLEVVDLNEKLGQGVSGKIGGHSYELKTLSDSLHEDSLGLVLLEDGQAICRLYFQDPLRSDAKSIISQLQGRGYQCFLLSGDRRARVNSVAEACGLDSRKTFAELFPEDKRDLLIKHQGTCMIGDGANDALSLQAADVGIAVKGSTNLSLQAADIYFTHAGLSPLVDLLNLAQKTRKVLIRNLSISLIYNVIGGTLALAGFINPGFAAILMPVSSMIIVLSTLWGLR